MYIVLEHTRNFSARLIQFWMFVDAVWHKKVIKKTYNHSFVCEGIIIWEAIDKGVFKTTFDRHYTHSKYNKSFNSKHIKLTLSPLEKIKMINYLREQEGKEYEYSNFAFHPLKTIFNKWIGRKDDNKLYCYELVIRALNASGKYNLDPYMNPREFFEWVVTIK